ncbi:MAG: hypothetical protein AABW50_03320 [Nanoarchaeota archaeon]|mgnify:CR=1 FL=1
MAKDKTRDEINKKVEKRTLRDLLNEKNDQERKRLGVVYEVSNCCNAPLYSKINRGIGREYCSNCRKEYRGKIIE